MPISGLPLDKFSSNEYWFRIWVQQKIAYAAHWTVQCRRHDISDQMFNNVCNSISDEAMIKSGT